jgi:trimeric autotransporter adhesin
MSQVFRFFVLTVALLGTISAVQASPQASDAAKGALTAPNSTQLSVPRLVQFSGTLKDNGARAVSGVASVTFAIYAEQDGGTALWSETQNVLADANGRFSVLLGAATSAGVPPELFGTGQSRWLGVTVARQQEMPRVLLASVPYALRAADADTLGGLPASAFVTKSASPLTPESTAILATPEITNNRSSAAPAAPAQATPTGGGTTNFIPKWTSISALGNSILFQSGSNIGIGTTMPTETLDVNGNSIFRGSFQLPPGHDATSSSGFESHSFQFQASSFNSSTGTSNTEAFGFRAEPLNNNTTNPSAKLDLFFGAGGSAPFTDTGLSFAANGVITFAPGQTFPTASTVNELNLPNTTSSTSGVINMGGVPFISNPGVQNAFFGASAGAPFTTTGFANTAVGDASLFSDTSGSDNTAVGDSALNENTTGGSNVAVGEVALFTNTVGSENTAVGTGSGLANISGNSNTFIGAGSNAPIALLNNATAIGANSFVGANNTLVLGSIKGVNQATSSVRVGIGTSTPRSTLEISVAPTEIAGVEPALTLSGNSIAITPSIDFNSLAPTSFLPEARIETYIPAGATFPDYAINFLINNGTKMDNLMQISELEGKPRIQVIGDLFVSGNISKGSGSFKIDDPIDPAGKYLSHSFVESPDMMNIYNGSVVLDAGGRATIKMPTWFDALNQDFQYQLTAIGAPGPRLYVAREIHNNRFSIAGGKPGLKVSWQVTGIRHDAYANAHRIPTEEAKPASEQGHYLHPELFGASPEQAVGAAYTVRKQTQQNSASSGTARVMPANTASAP